jgi:hypothetical protein
MGAALSVHKRQVEAAQYEDRQNEGDAQHPTHAAAGFALPRFDGVPDGLIFGHAGISCFGINLQDFPRFRRAASQARTWCCGYSGEGCNRRKYSAFRVEGEAGICQCDKRSLQQLYAFHRRALLARTTCRGRAIRHPASSSRPLKLRRRTATA